MAFYYRTLLFTNPVEIKYYLEGRSLRSAADNKCCLFIFSPNPSNNEYAAGTSIHISVIAL